MDGTARSDPATATRDEEESAESPSTKSGVQHLLASLTPCSKFVSAVLLFGYILSNVYPASQKQLALVPDKTLPSVWNLATAGFFELSFFKLVFNVACLLHIGQALEPIWGGLEFIKFLLVVNICMATATFLAMYVLYFVSRDEFYLYAECCGLQGAVAGLCVAVKQLLARKTLSSYGPQGRWYLPTYIYATITLCIVSGAEHHRIGLYFFVIFGAYFGWLYLRFFQAFDTGVGDDSDDFAFETLFPEPVQPTMKRLSQTYYQVFCMPAVPTHTQASVPITPALLPSGSQVNMVEFADPLMAPSPYDDDRRKELSARGARLLEVRLMEKSGKASKSTDKSVIL